MRKAHFGLVPTLLAPAGLPVFVYLLLRSQLRHRLGRVTWKGRNYDPRLANRYTKEAVR